MINSRWLYDPLKVVSVLFGLQFLFWLFFFPDTPTVPTGEPRSHNIVAQLFFGVLFILLFAGMFWGVASGSRYTTYRRPSSREQRLLLKVGKYSFWISTIAMATQLYIFIQDPSLVLLLGQPYGQNQLARMMHEASPAYIPTLAWLITLPIAIFSLFWFFTPKDSAFRKRPRAYTTLGLVQLLAYSTLGMSRQALLVGVILVAGAWGMANPKRLRLVPTVVVILVLFAFIFVGSALRMAGLDGALSGDTYAVVWADFVEKYLAGELNSAYIMLSYPTDVSRNWLYSTMFSRFAPDSFAPPYYLNTMNSLALWYWQFDWLSMVVTPLIGFGIGRLYLNARRRQFMPSYVTVLYLLTLPAVYTMIRVNSFFLPYFLVPVLFLLVSWVLGHLKHQPSARLQVKAVPSVHQRPNSIGG